MNKKYYTKQYTNDDPYKNQVGEYRTYYRCHHSNIYVGNYGVAQV